MFIFQRSLQYLLVEYLFLTHAIRIVWMRALVFSATNVNLLLSAHKIVCPKPYVPILLLFPLYIHSFFTIFRMYWDASLLKSSTIMRLKWCLFPLSYFTVFNPVASFRLLASLSFIFIFTYTNTYIRFDIKPPDFHIYIRLRVLYCRTIAIAVIVYEHCIQHCIPCDGMFVIHCVHMTVWQTFL